MIGSKMVIYLACPYWHEDACVRYDRFEAVNEIAGKIMEYGHVVFSPISHSVPISGTMENKDHDFWLGQDFPLLEMCDEMWIVPLAGWEDSVGVGREIKHALKHNIPCKLYREEK